MFKKSFLFYGMGCFSVCCGAQQLNPTVLSAAGEISKAAGISLEWTLGEPIIESLSSADWLYTQGFHQPLLIVKKFPVYQEQLKGYKVTVAPNPVQTVLTAIINAPGDETIYLTLIDITGKRFPAQEVQGKFSMAKVDMTGKIAGIYLLELRNARGQVVQNFKVIKCQ